MTGPRGASFDAHKPADQPVEDPHWHQTGNDPVGETIWHDRIAYLRSRRR
jgi:hypothetical protein